MTEAEKFNEKTFAGQSDKKTPPPFYGNHKTTSKGTSISDIEVQDSWIELSSENFRSFEDTSPAYCCVGEEVIEAKTWEDVLVEIANREIERENPALDALYQESLLQNKNFPFLMKSEIHWMKCRQLVNKYWISVDYNIPSLVRTVFNLCSRCGYREEQIRIYGVKKEADSSVAVKQEPIKPEETENAAPGKDDKGALKAQPAAEDSQTSQGTKIVEQESGALMLKSRQAKGMGAIDRYTNFGIKSDWVKKYLTNYTKKQ